MIKKQFTLSARRARNIIWNAAGRYDFEPPFMAFFPNGNPDNYFNMVVGFTQKWLDLPRIWDFFAAYEGDRRAEEFDEYLWLGLENCVYEKEVRERPILADLRRKRAEQFYVEQASLSRQQMEYQSMPVYTQQEARWASVCGKHAPILPPKEKQMAESLRFPGELDTDGVLERMRDFLTRFFRYVPGESVTAPRKAGRLALRLLRREHVRRDHLLIRTGTGEGNHPRAVSLRHEGLGRYVPPTEEDEKFIRAVFGRSMLSEPEMRILENELCTEEDALCRLWVTKGDDPRGIDRESADILQSSRRQQERNSAFYQQNAALIRSSVKSLSAKLDTILSTYFKHMPEKALTGRISPENAFRLPVLQDGKVFLKDGEEIEQEIFVDLLLDASQSRMNSQEVLSSEAYILAKSLTAVHIPVRIFTFRSFRGFTILDMVKSVSSTECRGTSRYSAAGWNRDSLALKALGRLDDDPMLQGKRRVILIMTDASPNDSAPLGATERLIPREYDGAAAVKATENAVRALRSQGIRVGAVFHGNSSHIDDLHQIYGHAYVRIRKASQLAQGVSDLLLMLLREMRND